MRLHPRPTITRSCAGRHYVDHGRDEDAAQADDVRKHAGEEQTRRKAAIPDHQAGDEKNMSPPNAASPENSPAGTRRAVRPDGKVQYS